MLPSPDVDVVPLPPARHIDHGSPVPLYFQLKGALEREIVATRWPQGGRLPAEGNICEHFGISRSTARQALGMLESEGMITRHKGRGTFVSDSTTKSWLLQAPGGFFHDEVGRQGYAINSRVLRAAVERLPPWGSDALGVPAGADGVHLERVRHVQGQIALYETSFLPAELAPTVLAGDVERGSLYSLLEREHGLTPVGGRRALEALPAPKQVAGLLDVKTGTPLAYVDSVTWDAVGKPFHCYRAWVRTDRMRIEIQVVSAPARPDGAPPPVLLADAE
jgi:GntR family transcriptional regulator